MTRTTLALITLVGAAVISWGAYNSRPEAAAPALTTAAATRGDIVKVISTTGTLQAVTTVQVGAQVSGIVESLPADFNSIVKKGQILARLDPSEYQTEVQQAGANLGSAEADAERLQVAKSAADTALARARELSKQQLIPAADLQTAETLSLSAAAQVVGADAKVQQARTAVRTAQLNLSKTVIASPIDGVVLARNVDVGQTVAASFSAPTLFVIAADLSAMQLNANIDESDLGPVAVGQPVTFRVDAYPSETFRGTVSQVRLMPITVDNVVTYAAMIDAPNPALKLTPGMTATATIEVARHDNVLRVPAAALRFKPDAATLARFAPKIAATPLKGSQTVWVLTGSTIEPVAVTLGTSDGTQTEIVGAPFAEGTQLVTRASATPTATVSAPTATSNPMMPSRPQGPRTPGR